FEFSKPKLYKRLWYASGQRVVRLALTQERFTHKGLPLMAARNLNSTNAWCGPACQVVWQGLAGGFSLRRPYADAHELCATEHAT
ncbi:MAG TPA: hypothetical protein VFN67_40430, partial [Polyangiales bacterium]|nr:hypothetical protein [Polyangiales bacterium]